MPFSIETLDSAAKELYKVIQPTPQFNWPLLSERLGFQTWVKHENFQPVGSFKIRGALAYCQALRKNDPSITGVIAATRGNFGQGVAYAARELGLTATVVTPIGNSPDKNRCMRAWGAEVVEAGIDFQDACEQMHTIAKARNLHIIPSFDAALISGTASIGLEFFRACPDLDVVYSSIGLGSNLCGLIAARNALGLKTKIIGVVTEAIPAYAESFKARRAIESPAGQTTIADGLDCRKPNEAALEIMYDNLERIITVSEAEIFTAMRTYFDDCHMIAEGAGAAPLAGLLSEADQYNATQKAGVVLCGGNITSEQYFKAFQAEYISKNRSQQSASKPNEKR